MQSIHRIILLVAFAALFATACGQSEPKPEAAPETEGKAEAAPVVARMDVPELSNQGMADILAESKGKVVFLCFWSVTCPACDREIPELEALADKYGDDELRLLLVNVDPTPAQVGAYFGDYQPLGEVYHATNDLAEAFGVYKIPHLVMYTNEGVKLLDQSGFFPEKMLEALVEHGLGRGDLGGMGKMGSMGGGS